MREQYEPREMVYQRSTRGQKTPQVNFKLEITEKTKKKFGFTVKDDYVRCTENTPIAIFSFHFIFIYIFHSHSFMINFINLSPNSAQVKATRLPCNLLCVFHFYVATPLTCGNH